MLLPNVDINYLAILVCAIIQMVIGYWWYSESGFGKMWVKSLGLSKQQINDQKNKGMGIPATLGFLMALVINFVLAHFIRYLSPNTFIEGMFVGFMIWIGFILTVVIGPSLWEGKSFKSYYINAGYYLVILLLNAGILAVWI